MKYLLLLLLPFYSLAQSKFDGIGKFRIGITTIGILEEFAKENKVKIQPSSKFMDALGPLEEQTSKILLLQGNEKEPYCEDPMYKVNSDTKVYFIDVLNVADISFKRLYLSFYKDTLYSFHCDGSTEISEALSIKYGNPKIEVTTKEITCRSRIAGEFKEEEKTYSSTWSSGVRNVKIVNVTGQYLDDKCEKNYFSYFDILNWEKEHLITSLESKIKDEMKAKADANKKAKLSEL